MEEKKQKVLLYIIFFIILIITTSVFTKGYDYSKKKENTNSYEIQEERKTTNNDVVQNNTEVTNNDINYSNVYTKARFYYSSDNKYYLILTNNFRAYSNPDMGTQDKRFLMNIDNFYSTDSFTGTYEIKDNQIILTIEAGCLDKDDKFTCVIPDKVNIYKNIMTLDYKENEISFGVIKLIEQN